LIAGWQVTVAINYAPLHNQQKYWERHAMFIGIDIGTSSVKSVLLDENDTIIASESAALTVQRPHENWSEQNPEDWWKATLATIDALAAKHPTLVSAVSGMGLSGQQHGATCIDRFDKVIRPCILWNDGRSPIECAELEAALPESRAISGNMAMPGFTMPKILWMAKHEPQNREKIAKVLLPKDYIRLMLTGEYACDMADAGSTLWLNVEKRDWSDKHLALTGLDRGHMPTLYEGTESTGQLRDELQKRWGMRLRPVMAGGGGDNPAAACGVGVVRDGDASVSLGTSGVIFVSNAKYAPNPDNAVHAMCHSIPDMWHQMGVILSAAASMEWWSHVAGKPAHELSAAVQTPSKSSGALFMPYLGGERTPHNDMTLRGSFIGLSHVTDQAMMTQAVMEGVAYAFRDNLDALKAAGTKVGRVMALGGGSRSKVWLQIMASMLGVPVDVPQDGDFGGAYGAARLGRVAATGEDPFSVCKAPPIKDVIDPIPALAASYDDGIHRYRKSVAASRL
jgi:xylulokinase